MFIMLEGYPERHGSRYDYMLGPEISSYDEDEGLYDFDKIMKTVGPYSSLMTLTRPYRNLPKTTTTATAATATTMTMTKTDSSHIATEIE